VYEEDLEAGRAAIERLAEQLRTLERLGDLPAARKLLRNLFRHDAAVGAAAGHKARWADRPEFWKHMLAQVAKASRGVVTALRCVARTARCGILRSADDQ
jgi:hypothetical protein